jgi:hypothetical protein
MARRADADFSDVDLNKDSKKLLSALLARETFKPNPSLGGSVLNGLAMGLMGLNEKWDEERGVASQKGIVDALYGSDTRPMPTSVPPAITSAPDVQVPAPGTVAGSPQEHINNTWGGLTPQGRDVATRTVLGEASNQGPLGMQAVADVLRNRAVQGGYRTGSQGPTTMDRVALAPGQFEPHMTQGGRDRMEAYSANSPMYQTAQGAVDAAAIGGQPDVTGGATHFYSPKAQASLGRQPPAWDDGTGRDIGGHRFFGPKQAPVQTAQLDPRIQQLQQIYNDPKTPNATKSRIGAWLIQQKTKAPEYETKEVNGLLYQIDKSGRTPPKMISPGGEQGAIDYAARKAAATKAAEVRGGREAVAADLKKQAQQVCNIVVKDIDRAIKLVDTSTLPTTGLVGGLLSNVGGTAARDVRALVDTVKANIGFQELSKMRQASPTGGALGQVTVRELELLQATIANLEQSQTAGQFKENLGRVKEAYLDIVHGPGNRPESGESKTRRYNPETGKIE